MHLEYLHIHHSIHHQHHLYHTVDMLWRHRTAVLLFTFINIVLHFQSSNQCANLAYVQILAALIALYVLKQARQLCDICDAFGTSE